MQTLRTLAILVMASLVVLPAARAEQVLTPEDLAGTWTWQQSVGSVAGTTEEPDAGEFVQIEFSENFKLRVTRNGVLHVGTYELGEGPLGGQTIRMLLEDPDQDAFPSLTLEMGLSLSLDRIRLDEPCCDLWSHTFVFDAAGLVPVSRTSFSDVKKRWEDGAR